MSCGRPTGPVPPMQLAAHGFVKYAFLVSKFMTKISGVSQRCQYCDKPFKLKKGRGRRAIYCTRRCRQRAYEANKISVPARILAPVATNITGTFFRPEDAEALFQRSGTRAKDGTEFGYVAEKLSLIAQRFIYEFRHGTAPTAGERQEWLRHLVSHGGAFLEDFGISGPFDALNDKAVTELLWSASAKKSRSLYHRQAIQKELGAATEPTEWHILRAGLRCVQLIMQQAKSSLDAAEPHRGANRTAPVNESNLVAGLQKLFTEAAGDQPRYIRVEFICAAALFIHNRCQHGRSDDGKRPLIEPTPPDAALEGLKRLGTKRSRVITRLRTVKKWQPK
jgi:hypothetical protein